MKLAILAFVLTCSVFLMSPGVAAEAAKSPPLPARRAVQKWEYKVIDLSTLTNPQAVTAQLNTEGEAGWELVSVAPYSNEQLAVAVFKRRK
jgi:hypothetical protein